MKLDPLLPINDDAVVELALLMCARDTLLPELLQVFGRQALVKFVDIFSGMTIKVPQRRWVGEAIINADIYLRMSHNPKNRDQIVEDLSNKYNVSIFEINQRFLAVKNRSSDLRLRA